MDVNNFYFGPSVVVVVVFLFLLLLLLLVVVVVLLFLLLLFLVVVVVQKMCAKAPHTCVTCGSVERHDDDDVFYNNCGNDIKNKMMMHIKMQRCSNVWQHVYEVQTHEVLLAARASPWCRKMPEKSWMAFLKRFSSKHKHKTYQVSFHNFWRFSQSQESPWNIIWFIAN